MPARASGLDQTGQQRLRAGRGLGPNRNGDEVIAFDSDQAVFTGFDFGQSRQRAFKNGVA